MDSVGTSAPGSTRGTPGVTPLVRRAWHATRLARTAEALMLGVGLGLLTLAAAWNSGAGFGWLSLSIAALAGVAFGASWRIEQHPRLAGVAHGVDEGLHLGGALLTAFEAEQRRANDPIAQLLSLHVRSRVRVVEAVRAALPSSLPFLAAPLLGAAVLLGARQRVEDPYRPSVSVAPALGVLADCLAEAKRIGFDEVAAGRRESDAARDVAQLEREARSLAEESRLGGEAEVDTESLERRLDWIDQQLERHLDEASSRGSGATPEARAGEQAFRQALEMASAHLDSARYALGESGKSGEAREAGVAQGRAGSGSGEGRTLGMPRGREVGETAPDSGPDPDNSTGSLASTDESGTIPPSEATSDPGSDPPASSNPATPESPDPGGLSGAGSWPARHVDLVGAWTRTLRKPKTDPIDD